MRFIDENTVSIPEFLNFFLNAPIVRQAKAVSGALRGSMSLLHVDSPAHDINNSDNDMAPPIPPARSSTGITNALGVESAIQTVLSHWSVVDALFSSRDTGTSNKVTIPVNDFKVVISIGIKRTLC